MSSSFFCSLRKVNSKNLPLVSCFGESKFCWQSAKTWLRYHLGSIYAKWLALIQIIVISSNYVKVGSYLIFFVKNCGQLLLSKVPDPRKNTTGGLLLLIQIISLKPEYFHFFGPVSIWVAELNNTHWSTVHLYLEPICITGFYKQILIWFLRWNIKGRFEH